jgi:hypothetical protein
MLVTAVNYGISPEISPLFTWDDPAVIDFRKIRAVLADLHRAAVTSPGIPCSDFFVILIHLCLPNRSTMQFSKLQTFRKAIALIRSLVILLGMLSAFSHAAPLPEPSPEKLPRWRGFNLLEKFYFTGRHVPFREDDFRLISELGFNFVRLPMDYRGYVVDGDWNRFDEKPLSQIDEAVAWGRKYGIHVCLNLHRAPGWTVASPPEPNSLWTDEEASDASARHWAMFAKRYRGIPNANLSFNLFNEPAGITEEAYLAVVRKVLAAIRAEDPDRLVLCDGLEWGRVPVSAMIPLDVGMMTRGYEPFRLTHYQANWVEGSAKWDTPTWPEIAGTGGTLISPAKKELSQPLRISGAIPAGSTLRMVAAGISSAATLTVSDADGRELWRQSMTAGPEKGPWSKVTHDGKQEHWRAEGEVEMKVAIPDATDGLELKVVEGDWLYLSSVGIRPPGNAVEAVAKLFFSWKDAPEVLEYRPASVGGPKLCVEHRREWLWQHAVKPWRDFANAGGGVMVGEWGAHQRTPHDVLLRWAEDSLRNWKEAGLGWALWNFRGNFGILDSGRLDVTYEDFHGHKLDRKFLELLQRY